MSTCNKFVLYCVLVVPLSAIPSVQNFDIWGDLSSENNSVRSDDVSALAPEKTQATNETRQRLPKVLNFFPVPVEDECLSNDNRRKGICLNTYECRIQGGSSHGPCALGFGVCCVLTCDQEIFNNLTYFVNPHFPDLSNEMTSCSLKVKKIDPEISQLRLDFIHFNLGQPNRRTGVCEEDTFLMSGGNASAFTLCGLNSGQHMYFDVDNSNDLIDISMNLSKIARSRMWEIRVTQVPFTQRAPAGCFQYHTGSSGFIRTMNFAENGRRLANQDYSICTRQEEGMCTIAYEPCDENSFRIGSNNDVTQMATQDETQMVPQEETGDVGSGDGDAPQARMDACVDKVVMPCDSEDLIMDSEMGVGFCDIVHCGNSLCPVGENPCRIESSITPFTIGVHFGQPKEESPEDNIGMCLQYEQLPCLE